MSKYIRRIKFLYFFVIVLSIFSFTKFALALDTPPFEIVKSFVAPNGPIQACPHGLAWDGEHLWLSDTCQYKIFELTTDGEVVSYFDWHLGDPQGLTWDGNFLWTTSSSTRKVYQLTREGVLHHQFDAPGPWPTGLAWDGETLWLSDGGDFWGDGRIYQLTTDGNVVSWFKLPSSIEIPRDLAFDGVNLWLTDQHTHTLHKISTSGVVLASCYFSEEFGISGILYGLAWDGHCLWLSTESDDMIYQLRPTQPQEPVIEIILNKTEFTTGEELIVQMRLTNNETPDEVGIKVWLSSLDLIFGPLHRCPPTLLTVMRKFPPFSSIVSILDVPKRIIPAYADITKEIYRYRFGGFEAPGEYNVSGKLIDCITGDTISIDKKYFSFSP